MISLVEFQGKERPKQEKLPNETDAVADFGAALRDAGLFPEGIVPDGEIHRFNSGKGKNLDGYYSFVLNDYGGHGIYGDWSVDDTPRKWSSYNESSLNSQDLAKLRIERARQAEQHQREAQERAAQGARTASERLSGFQAANGSFEYVKRKQVGVFDNIRWSQFENLLAIPLYNEGGDVITYQRIWPDGTKRFMAGGSAKGGFYPVIGDTSVVCICEGYATGWSINHATGYQVFCAFNAGNLSPVAEMVRKHYPHADIIICADNDHTKKENVGLTKGIAAAKASSGRVVAPDPIDGVSDFNDLATLNGVEAVAKSISLDKQQTGRRFGYRPVGELLGNIRPTKWLVKGILEDEVLAVLFGSPGSYKSFMALSWACCIATGTPWHGHEVEQGPVFYIVGEGANGMAKRFAAWSTGTGVKLNDAPLYVSTAPTQMLDDDAARQVAGVISELRAMHGRPAAIVIDTLARNFGPGDENSTADMSKFVTNLDRFVGNGCLRLIVHHTGHGNKDRARGNSALVAAVDAEYRLIKNEDKTAALAATKMKDEPEWNKEMVFSPNVAVVSRDFDEDIKSLYLTHDGNQEKNASMKPTNTTKQMSEQQEGVYNICKDIIAEGRANSPDETALIDDVIDAVLDAELYKKPYHARRALSRLEKRELIRVNGDLVSVQ